MTVLETGTIFSCGTIDVLTVKLKGMYGMKEKSFIGSAIILAVVCLLLHVQCMADAKDDDVGSAVGRLAGKWSGIVDQPGGEISSYTIVMTLESSGGGTVDYPDLKCGGTLTRIRSEGEYFFYRERIAYGKETCIDGGTMRLKLQDGKLELYWFESATIARALLTAEKQAVRSEAQPVDCLSCTAAYDQENSACAMNISDLKARAKCRDDAVNALRKCLSGCRN